MHFANSVHMIRIHEASRPGSKQAPGRPLFLAQGCHAHGFAWACEKPNVSMATQSSGHGTPQFIHNAAIINIALRIPAAESAAENAKPLCCLLCEKAGAAKSNSGIWPPRLLHCAHAALQHSLFDNSVSSQRLALSSWRDGRPVHQRT